MQDDDGARSGWRAQGNQPPESSQTRGMSGRRGALLGLVAVATLTAIGLVTACVYGMAAPLLASVLASPPTVSPVVTSAAPRSSVQTTAGAATATSGNSDWDTFTVYDGGFRVDVPGVLSSSHGYFINNFSGQGVDLSYTGAALATPLQRLEAEVKVSVLYSTRITDHNICPQGGSFLQVGAGTPRISAWERVLGDMVVVNLVLNGVAIEIHMTSRVSGQPALPRYAEIWTHMLASIAPLPGQPPATTHPCG